MKNLKLLQILALGIGLMLLTGNVWGQVNIIPIRTDVSGFPEWTDNSVGGTTYLQLLVLNASTISPAMNFNNYSSETLNFKARTFGGVNATENEVFVSISTDNGANWTPLGSRTPTSTTLTAMAPFDLSSYNGTQVKVRFLVLGTNNSVGAGIDDIAFTGVLATSGPDDPQSFSATAFSSAQINLTAVANGSGNNILVAYNLVNTFGTPSGAYLVGNPITGGGTVHYVGAAGSLTNHSGLNPGQTVYYKAWSYNGSDYSTGLSANATTFEPTITVNPSTLSGFTYVFESGPSAEQTFTISGSNLTADVSVAASTNYEISKSTGTGYTSPLTFTPAEVATPQTVYVRLKAGLAIGTYNGEEITATSAGADNKIVTCNGSVSDPNVNIEDFANYPETGTTYNTGTFLGQDGSTWNYVKCAGPAAGNIDAPSPLLGRNQTPSAEIYSGTINGGIGTMSFEYMQAFSTNVSLNVYVNGNLVGNVTSSSQQSVVLNSGDIVVNVAGDFVLEFAQNGSGGQVSIDNVTWTPYSTGGNLPPSITNIVQNPASGITSTTTVSVSADVTDSDGTVEGVELHWGTTSGVLTNNIDMTLSSGNTYTTVSDIPAQLDGTTVYYEIYAIDNDADDATSAEQSYTVTNPVTEPSNHPTNFAAVVNSSSAIIVAWDDAVPAADGYLIKASATSYAAIDEPEDGTPEGDALLVQNIAAGVEIFEFTGLAASTQYFFKIYPYNGSGASINYLITGAPEATATTDEPEVVKWDGGASTTAWADAANWSTNVVPAATDVVLLDNSLVSGSYEVILPSGAVKTTISKLTISPDSPNTITLTLPSVNTYGATNDAGFVVGDNTASTDDIIINAGGVLINASGASSGNGIQVNALANGTLRINDGGKYIHKTARSTNGSAAASILSTVAGTEYGIFEYDVPGTSSFAIAATGRTYGSLVLTRTDGAATYTSAGSSALTVKGDFTINSGVTYSTTMSAAMNIAGDFTNNGAALIIPSGQAVNFNGTAVQVVSGINEITLQGAVTISGSSVVHIDNTSKVTVTGALTNNATATGLVIKSDATGTGSLIHSTVGVQATMERFMNDADWGNWQDGWHFLGSPVASQAISPAFTTDPASGYDFYLWNEPTNQWINFKNQSTNDPIGDAPFFDVVNGSNNFAVGRGYMAAYDAGGVKSFAGALNVADVSVAGLGITGSSGYKSWHLLGNPFASAITWDATAAWGLTNIAGVAKIWNELNQSYTDLTSSPSSVIPATNGFMVQAVDATGSLTIPAAKRAHSSQAFYKSAVSDMMLTAKSLTAGNAQEARIVINPDATAGFDLMFDSEFLAGHAPSFYSLAGESQLSTNSIPELTAETEIPFAFIKNAGSQFSIEASGFEEIPGIPYLIDLKSGTSHNLADNPVYNFTAVEGDNPNRFLLKFEAVSVDEVAAGEQTKIYSFGDAIFISANITTNAMISIYNITGQQVYGQRMVVDGLKQINLNLPTGWYVVKVNAEQGLATQKVFIR